MTLASFSFYTLYVCVFCLCVSKDLGENKKQTVDTQIRRGSVFGKDEAEHVINSGFYKAQGGKDSISLISNRMSLGYGDVGFGIFALVT